MRFTKNQKIAMGAVGSLMVIIILGIVYAAFTQQLTINGSATGRSSSWRVYFSSLSNVSLTGTAKELTTPTIDSNNQTSIGDYSVTVTSPGDSVEYTFDVTNSGDYDATLSGLAKTNPSCTGTGDNASTDATNVCGKLTYTLKYADGTTVSQNDTLKSKETKTMKLKLTYETFNDASLLPQADVTITGLGITLTYTQDGNAKVNADGTTPYNPYPIGNEITVAGEQYYVISSNSADDYVVALKAEPLLYEVAKEYKDIFHQGTVADVSNMHDVGGYCSIDFSNLDNSNNNNDYSNSYVKRLIDLWANDNFTYNELKVVDGYSARLLEYEETFFERRTVCTVGCYEENALSEMFRFNQQYWTMTPYNDSSTELWVVSNYGQLVSSYIYTGQLIRPVINVYKSKISS